MADSTGILLWQATNRWLRQVQAVLAPHGLTYVQFLLLAAIADRPDANEAPTQVDLARRLRADVMMTSQVLRALERRRLVVRDLDPRDARARQVRLTAAGARLVERVSAIVGAAEDAYFAALGVERNAFAGALGRLIGIRVRLRVPVGGGIIASGE